MEIFILIILSIVFLFCYGSEIGINEDDKF